MMEGQKMIEQQAQDSTERVLKRILNARLPRRGSLRSFDVSNQKSVTREELAQLADPEWLDKRKNLLIRGPSAAGKTHLAAALGKEWCWGRRVLFSNADQLIARLTTARPTVQADLKRLDRYDALIVDDLSSWIASSKSSCDLLVALLQHRLNRRSVIITSNLSFFSWNAISLDQSCAWFLLEQLEKNSVIIQLDNCCLYPGKSGKKKCARTKPMFCRTIKESGPVRE